LDYTAGNDRLLTIVGAGFLGSARRSNVDRGAEIHPPGGWRSAP
jgi:hypothetical protein